MSPRPQGWRRAEARHCAARHCAALALIAALALGGVALAEGTPEGNGTGDHSRRVVAVGDIHGAFNGVREILRKSLLIDQRDNWVGGDAILVQTGDFLDRGPGATKVAELLMNLQDQAPEQGGEVIVLLGNHEILNLLGDLRDVTKYIVRNLVDGHSEKRLTVSCNEYASFYRKLAQLRHEKAEKRRELVNRCFAERPLGLMEYIEEVGPTGRIGRWIRQLPAAARVGDVVFVHGGISPELADVDLEKMNREARREIRSFDATRQYLLDNGLILPTTSLPEVLSVARQLAKATSNARTLPPLSAEFLHVLQFEKWYLVREDGPFWFRGYARWSNEEGAELLPPILDSLGADYVVVGHTPQPPFIIRNRFESRVYLIDTGMLTSFYKGSPSALEIQDGRFTALYLTKQNLLYEPRAVALTN
ncbi:MAG: hypothetical protein GY719_33560 [bacterium]|nr:hypothetical protein [bacterium]